MVEDEIQAIQKSVEKDLFEEQNKVLDRFYSLITLTFTAFAFSITALSFFSGEEPLTSRKLSVLIISVFLFFVYFWLLQFQLLMYWQYFTTESW